MQLAFEKFELAGEPRGQVRVVGYNHKDRSLTLMKTQEQRSDGFCGGSIQVSCRLVAQEQVRLQDKRARQSNALFFASGQFGRAVVQPLAQADLLQ